MSRIHFGPFFKVSHGVLIGPKIILHYVYNMFWAIWKLIRCHFLPDQTSRGESLIFVIVDTFLN